MGIEIEKKGKITIITINNPVVKNAIDAQSALELVKAFREFEEDKYSRVAVLCGSEGNFCSGANLKAIENGTGNKLEREGDGPMGPTRMMLSKPVVAAISGYAVAGGLELALWCDLRIIEKNGIMGVFNRRWGIPLIDGGTIRLPRIIGLGRALDLILTGRPVTAEEALMMGLVTRVVDVGFAKAGFEFQRTKGTINFYIEFILAISQIIFNFTFELFAFCGNHLSVLLLWNYYLISAN